LITGAGGVPFYLRQQTFAEKSVEVHPVPQDFLIVFSIRRSTGEFNILTRAVQPSRRDFLRF